MKKIYLYLLIFIGLFTPLHSCGVATYQEHWFSNDFKPLKTVDQIVITVAKINENGTPSETLTKETIKDPERINQIILKFQTYSDKWQHEGFGPPWTSAFGLPAPIQLIFYNQEEATTYLIIGYTKNKQYFLQEGIQQGRYLEDYEYRDIMDFLKIDPTVPYYEWEDSSE